MKAALYAACAAFLLLAAGIILLRSKSADTGTQVTIGGPFSLIDGASHRVTDAQLHGRFMLVYFGYTHCPDVCPTTLGGIAEGISKLPKPDQQKIVPIFITVDPERDTPAVVGDYARAFGPEFVGLTGSAADIAKVEQEYRVYARKHPLSGGDYAMDHSSVIYVMDPTGAFAAVLDDTMPPAAMAAQLMKLGV